MKNIYPLLLILLLPLGLNAQENFYKFSVGAGGGITRNQGDLNTPQTENLMLGFADYYLTPYLHFGIELQSGKISGRESGYIRHYQTDLKAFIISGKIHIGQFLRERGAEGTLLKTIKGLYGGSGGGIIKSAQIQIFRNPKDKATYGADSYKDIFIPVCAGIDNSGFNSRVIAGLRYQANYIVGDQMDGYFNPGSKNDFYSTLTLSLKYKFGPTGVY